MITRHYLDLGSDSPSVRNFCGGVAKCWRFSPAKLPLKRIFRLDINQKTNRPFKKYHDTVQLVDLILPGFRICVSSLRLNTAYSVINGPSGKFVVILK